MTAPSQIPVRRRFGFGAWLVLATSVHALLAWAGAWSPTTNPTAADPTVPSALQLTFEPTLDIQLEGAPERSSETLDDPRSTEVATAAGLAADMPRAKAPPTRTEPRPHATEAPATASAAVVPQPPSAGSGLDSEMATAAGSGTAASPGEGAPKLPRPSLDLIGHGPLGAILPSDLRGGAPPAASAPPPSREQVVAARLDDDLKRALDQRDVALSGGSSGPVLAAARQAALGPDAPATGWAIYEVEFDASGQFKGGRIASTGGDRAGWARLEPGLTASLSKQRVKVPRGAAGLRVQVRVEAAMKLPSGARSSVPSVAWDKDFIHGTFDVADIGQKPSRVVAVTLVSQERM